MRLAKTLLLELEKEVEGGLERGDGKEGEEEDEGNEEGSEYRAKMLKQLQNQSVTIFSTPNRRHNSLFFGLDWKETKFSRIGRGMSY